MTVFMLGGTHFLPVRASMRAIWAGNVLLHTFRSASARYLLEVLSPADSG